MTKATEGSGGGALSSAASDATNFFSALPGLRSLREAGEPAHYVEPPRDWWVVVTDVVRSTVAIESGRYREVNLAGAATSVALRSAMGDEPFPFAFGGDGATALVPGRCRDAVAEALKALRQQVRLTMKLELRVGMVPVSALQDDGHPLFVARHAISRRFPLAFLVGEGFTEAERRVKAHASEYQLSGPTSLWIDLGELSCRWEAMPSRRGVVVSLIVRPAEGGVGAYRSLLNELSTVLTDDIEHLNPVHLPAMRYASLRSMWAQDRRVTRRGRERSLRVLTTLFAWLLFRLGLGQRLRRVRRYLDQTATHSDFHKLQDRLCMVLDCTVDEANALEALCSQAQAEGRVQYGMHRSATAVMTCLVGSFDEGEHVHFVDGGDGGYALAAKAMKKQLIAG